MQILEREGRKASILRISRLGADLRGSGRDAAFRLRVQGCGKRAARARAASLQRFKSRSSWRRAPGWPSPSKHWATAFGSRGQRVQVLAPPTRVWSQSNNLHEDLPPRMHTQTTGEAFHSLQTLPASFFQSNQRCENPGFILFFFQRGKRFKIVKF